MDFDNDGWKDLFISNGIPKRLTDIDYINYISNEEIQAKLQDRSMSEKDMALIDNFPKEIKLPNAFYKNNRDVFHRCRLNVAGNINTFQTAQSTPTSITMATLILLQTISPTQCCCIKHLE